MALSSRPAPGPDPRTTIRPVSLAVSDRKWMTAVAPLLRKAASSDARSRTSPCTRVSGLPVMRSTRFRASGLLLQ